MTEKMINCVDCEIEFTYEENPKYPRKYCFNCSAKRKRAFGELAKEPATDEIKKHLMNSGPIMTNIKPTKEDPLEYQIRSREVRCRALTSAMTFRKEYAGNEINEEAVLKLADQFVEWING